MPAGQKPTHILAIKREGETKWEVLAAGWVNSRDQITYTVAKQINVGDRVTSFKNTPRPGKNEPQPG